MPRGSHFCGAWLKESVYLDWLQKKDEGTARCSYCCKDIDVRNMGELALKSHMKSQKHKKLSPVTGFSLTNFLPTVKGKNSTVQNTHACPTDHEPSGSINYDVQSNPVKQLPINTLLQSEQVVKAEIRWILNVVLSKSSQHSCDSINQLFQEMFPDSAIAKKIQIGRTKCSYVIKYGIAPYFLELLYKEVSASPYHVISFDESLNRSVQRGQMDILVRFWNNESLQVQMQNSYWSHLVKVLKI